MTLSIPLIVKTAIAVALQHYPSLCDTQIEFRLIEGYGDKVMAAQPKLWSMLDGKVGRSYVIKMSKSFKLGNDKPILLEKLPEDVLIGWIGHELGHVVDYESKNNWGMIKFGLGYVFSSSSLQKAEYAADTYAIINGLTNYILSTKDFILNHADIPAKYKAKISRHYMSPEKVMEKVRDLESQNSDNLLEKILP